MSDKVAGRDGRPRPKPSADIACESLEDRRLLSMISDQFGGGFQRQDRAAHVQHFSGEGSIHTQGRLGRGHSQDLGAASTMISPTASGANTPTASGASSATTSGANTPTASGASSATTPDASSATASIPGTPTAPSKTLVVNNSSGPSGYSGAGSYGGAAGWKYFGLFHGAGSYSGGYNGGGNITATKDPTGWNIGGSNSGVPGTTPRLTAQEKTDLQKLQSDVQAIEAKSQVTVSERTAFRADLQAVSQPSGQPSSATKTALQTLQSDEFAILASGTFTSAHQTQIVNDFAAVLTSEGATQAQATQASTDLQKMITSSGITSTDVSQIDSDLTAIQTDFGTSSSTANSDSTPPSPASPINGGGLLANIILGQSPGGPMVMGMGGGRGMSLMGGMIGTSGSSSTGGTASKSSSSSTGSSTTS
jgi:hypothetical protein